MVHYTRAIFAILLLAMASPSIALAQQLSKPADNGKVEVILDQLTLSVGDKAQLKARLLDKDGQPTEGRLLYISRARRSLRVNRSGELTAIKPGTFEVIVRAVGQGHGALRELPGR